MGGKVKKRFDRGFTENIRSREKNQVEKGTKAQPSDRNPQISIQAPHQKKKRNP